ncbi:MAG: hypothetical protein Q8S84_00605 [bacterium]|nr:hypothetical protein [bacterium]MDP3380088.1 hypothetical protein [bacterium]
MICDRLASISANFDTFSSFVNSIFLIASSAHIFAISKLSCFIFIAVFRFSRFFDISDALILLPVLAIFKSSFEIVTASSNCFIFKS